MEKWRQYRQPRVFHELDNPPKQFRPHWHLPRWLVLALVFLACLFGLAWLVFDSPILRVATVQPGGELTDPITHYVSTLVGQNILRISERRVTQELQAVEPTVATVRLTRGFPNELLVTVTRRHPVLIWQVGDTQWAIDAGGVAFPFDPTVAGGIPRIRDLRNPTVSAGQVLVSPSFVTFVRDVFTELPARIGGSLRDGEIVETSVSFKVITEWGWSIYLDSRRPLLGQLNNLNLVLRDYHDQIHEYVDLRLPGWGYVK